VVVTSLLIVTGVPEDEATFPATGDQVRASIH